MNIKSTTIRSNVVLLALMTVTSYLGVSWLEAVYQTQFSDAVWMGLGQLMLVAKDIVATETKEA